MLSQYLIKVEAPTSETKEAKEVKLKPLRKQKEVKPAAKPLTIHILF